MDVSATGELKPPERSAATSCPMVGHPSVPAQLLEATYHESRKPCCRSTREGAPCAADASRYLWPPPPSFVVPSPLRHHSTDAEAFGCMKCQLACKSKAGEGAHMFKVHGFAHPVRQLFQTSQCAICLTEYFSFGKLKHHLIRSDHCRQRWHGMRLLHTPAPGLGSSVDEEMKQCTDGLLPPLRAEGPMREFQRCSDFSLILDELYEDLALNILHATSLSALEQVLRDRITLEPLSWTRCFATLDELRTNLENEAQDLGELPFEDVVRLVKCLQTPGAWPFIIEDSYVPVEHFTDLQQIETACGAIDWDPQALSIPRSWGRHRIVLHAFAGGRRPGDFQYYLDRMLETCEDGTYIHAVSMDIIYDSTLGDASLRSTQDFWYHGIDCSWVVGFIGGPPCETWSKARGVAVDAKGPLRGPRVIRTAAELWGLNALGLKELAQISIGNDLLLFSIFCLFRLALRGGVGILEHPAEPDAEDAAAIWKLQILILLTHLPGVEVLQIMQGHFGAPSPSLNLPGLPAALHQCTVCDQPPRRSAIGLQSDGQWATSKLKEYPPALCFAFAKCFFTHLKSVPISTDSAQAETFLSKCQSLLVQHFSDHFGKDFAGWRLVNMSWIHLATWPQRELLCAVKGKQKTYMYKVQTVWLVHLYSRVKGLDHLALTKTWGVPKFWDTLKRWQLLWRKQFLNFGVPYYFWKKKDHP